MAEPVDPAFHDRLQALRDKFAASVPERMLAISQALAQCQAQGQTAPHLEQLHHSLHTVAGSAGSFGFKWLGEESRRLEQMLRIYMQGEGNWADISDEIVQLLQRADKEFH
jgi:periplasmic divalent cation tolerance protein